MINIVEVLIEKQLFNYIIDSFIVILGFKKIYKIFCFKNNIFICSQFPIKLVNIVIFSSYHWKQIKIN